MKDTVLVADLGGTNARLAIASQRAGAISIAQLKKYRVADYPSAGDVIAAYLKQTGAAPNFACFAVAGPVTDDQVEFTNSGWVLNIAEMKEIFALSSLRVVNDFYALAAGVAQLGPDDFLDVSPGEGDAAAPTLVLGPGTGLGQALIVPNRGGEKIISTEGGHVAFAPLTDEERRVVQFLARDHPRVTVEDLVSGSGIENIYRALYDLKAAPPMASSAVQIAEAAMAGSDAIAVRALNLFCEMLGRVAGDAVLATGARGGVVLGGGILPKIRDIFLASEFCSRFREKGAMSYYVEDVSVRLIIADDAALRGAAVLAELK